MAKTAVEKEKAETRISRGAYQNLSTLFGVSLTPCFSGVFSEASDIPTGSPVYPSAKPLKRLNPQTTFFTLLKQGVNGKSVKSPRQNILPGAESIS
jgi:hypothetical protein